MQKGQHCNLCPNFKCCTFWTQNYNFLAFFLNQSQMILTFVSRSNDSPNRRKKHKNKINCVTEISYEFSHKGASRVPFLFHHDYVELCLIDWIDTTLAERIISCLNVLLLGWAWAICLCLVLSEPKHVSVQTDWRY